MEWLLTKLFQNPSAASFLLNSVMEFRYKCASGSHRDTSKPSKIALMNPSRLILGGYFLGLIQTFDRLMNPWKVLLVSRGIKALITAINSLCKKSLSLIYKLMIWIEYFTFSRNPSCFEPYSKKSLIDSVVSCSSITDTCRACLSNKVSIILGIDMICSLENSFRFLRKSSAIWVLSKL